MSDLSFVDVRPVLAKIADLERDLVLVGGQVSSDTRNEGHFP